MITEDYVSFEVAKLLKEKGFDANIHYFYDSDYGRLLFSAWNDMSKNDFLAPTLQMVMKWLREVHHLHIFTVPRWQDVEYMPGEWQEEMVGYQYVIIDIGYTNRKINHPITTALTPESSYEAAIKYCLENLI